MTREQNDDDEGFRCHGNPTFERPHDNGDEGMDEVEVPTEWWYILAITNTHPLETPGMQVP